MTQGAPNDPIGGLLAALMDPVRRAVCRARRDAQRRMALGLAAAGCALFACVLAAFGVVAIITGAAVAALHAGASLLGAYALALAALAAIATLAGWMAKRLLAQAFAPTLPTPKANTPGPYQGDFP